MTDKEMYAIIMKPASAKAWERTGYLLYFRTTFREPKMSFEEWKKVKYKV